MNQRCSRCSESMKTMSLRGTKVEACPNQHGYSLPLWSVEVLNKSLPVASIKQAASKKQIVGMEVLKCWSCLKDMRTISFRVGDKTRTLFFCGGCETVFFSQENFHMFFGNPSEVNTQLPTGEAFEVERFEGGDQVFSLLGLFKIRGVPEAKNVAYVSWGIVVLTFFFIVTNDQKFEAFKYWMFFNKAPLYHFGLNFLSSGFIHMGYEHWIGNSISLLLFSKSVEDDMGPFSYFMLFLISVFFGNVVYIFFHPDVALSAGASGGVFGIITYFCLRFQKAQISFRLGWSHALWIPGFAFLIGKVGLEYFAHKASGGKGSIGHLAHLGGAAGGLLWYISMSPDKEV